MVPATAPRVDDVIRWIDHAQRLLTADASLLYAKLIRIATAAGNLDDHIRAAAGFDTELAGEVVDRDAISGNASSFGLRSGRRRV